MSETQQILQKLGLEDQEIKTYLALLDLNESTATKLAENTGLGRVHMYQILNRLIERGLVSYVIKNNVKYFLPADPEKILKDLQEKEQEFLKILPKLKARLELPFPEIKVEVYRGLEGFKSVLNDRIKTGGDMYAFGVDEAKFKAKFATLMDQFFRREREKKLKEYIITSEKARFTYEQDHIQYKCISDEYFEPTATAIYKDRVFILIWEPFTTILIKNQELAESYRRHHKLLWEIAKEKK